VKNNAWRLDAVLSLLVASAFALGGCYSIAGMEVVQSVQTPDNGVPIVALKPTFVRIYVKSIEAWHGPWQVDARLSVKDAIAGTQHELAPLNPGPITVAPDGGQRDRWSQSFTFLLDRTDTYPGDRTLEARVFEAGATPPGQTFTQNWRFHPPVYASSYGVVWAVTNRADNSGAPIGPAAPWSDFAAHLAFVQNVYPVTGYTIVPLPGVGYAPPNPQPFNNLTESRTWASQMLANLPAGSRINLLDNWDTGGLHGYAWGLASEEQNERTGGRVGSTMAQEVAHNLGLWCHTFDVCTIYAQYPRKSGMIDAADMGFNVSGNFGRMDPQLVSRFDQRDANDTVSMNGLTADFMSYSFPTWVSSFTYCLLVGQLWKKDEATCSYARSIELELSDVVGRVTTSDVRSLLMTPLPPPGPTPPGEALFVAGHVDGDGRGKFTTSEVIPHATRVAPGRERGEFTLEIVGSDGTSLGHTAADVHSDHPQTTAPFSALIPSALLTDRAVAIRLKRGEHVLAEQALARQAPVVELAKFASDQLSGTQTLSWNAKDPDRQSLRYSILFSPDNGTRWWPLNVALAAESAPIDTDNLPGSDQALFMVRASNFGKSANSTPIGPYRIAPKAPRLVIEAPSAGASLETGTTVLVRASAFSWQEGMLNDPRLFSWRLNDRPVGEGDWTVLRNLSSGAHILKASVRDAGGRTAEASVNFTVTAPSRGSTPAPR
jgi:hypothetical protein